MSLDFLMLSVLFPTLLSDDMTRRAMNSAGVLRFIAIVPLIGPCVYLIGRSPLPDAEAKV